MDISICNLDGALRMAIERRTLLCISSLAILGIAVGAADPPAGMPRPPGTFHRVTASGSTNVFVGDVIAYSVMTTTGVSPQFNPTYTLKVEVKGKALSPKAHVVNVPPTGAVPPGGQTEMQAILTVDQPGEAEFIVTPISGKGESGTPIRFQVKASE